MKLLTLLSCAIAIIVPQTSFADHRELVPGHTNADGTFIAPHVVIVPDDATTTTTYTTNEVVPENTNIVIPEQTTGAVLVTPYHVNGVQEGRRGVNYDAAQKHDINNNVNGVRGFREETQSRGNHGAGRGERRR